MDLDDDLYWYSFLENVTEMNYSNSQNISIELWDVYKIHYDEEITINSYGNWSSEFGLDIATDEKWSRRRDMQVSFSDELSVPHKF